LLYIFDVGNDRPTAQAIIITYMYSMLYKFLII